MAEQGKMQSQREELAKPDGSVSVWSREITAALKHYSDYFGIAGKQLKRYRDERKNEMGEGTTTRVNFFWSNVQVLKSTLYAKPPKVDVSRLFRDYTDDVARVAGIIMERLLNHDLEKDDSDFDVAARQAIDDWLIVGSGQCWYRYEVETEQVPVPPTIDPMTGQQVPVLDDKGQPAMQERIISEDALSDYVYWKDFLCSPSRTWAECRWVARRVYMTKDSLEDRFGEEMADEVPLYSRTHGGATTSDTESDEPWATAEVWEIWCKTSKKVYWYVKGFDKFLDQRDDPLELEGFFPCPPPLLANQSNDTLIPRSDYSMARDQYQQIDVLATRLRLLISACKVSGAYDKDAAGALSNILEGADNKMVPVDNWALFGEKGGLKGVMDFVPIDQIASVVTILRQDMAEQKQQLYETLGIADIMRGATRASETATAQQIKAQFGSTRLQFKQFEVARFVRDAQRIKANIITKHYQPETMVKRSNIERTPDAQLVQPAIQMLKSEGMVQYRLNVEAESMAAMDWANERDARTQFLSAMGGFVQQVMPLAQMEPKSTPMLLQLLSWAMAGFRAGKEIEGVIDQTIQQMSQQPPGPDPEEKAKQDAMFKAELGEKTSSAAKNEASALKFASEAKQNSLENVAVGRIADVMARPVPMDSVRESYVPPPIKPPGGM